MKLMFIIIGTYFALLLVAAWYFSRRESLESYFVNQRQTGLFMLTLSNFASIVGAGATVAIITEMYRTGISFGIALPLSFLVGTAVLGILAYRIKALGDKHNARSIVDFFGQRFDMKNRRLMTVLQLIILLCWTGVQAIAMASLASVILGTSYALGITVAAIVTIIYVSAGGLKIDIISDVIQFWIIIFIFAAMSILAYVRVDGIGALLTQLPPQYLDIFAFGGVSWFIGASVLGGFIYMTNTSHWQRIFSARSPAVARSAFLLLIPLITAFSLLIVFIGLSSSVILPGQDAETITFALMAELFPPVLLGVGYAAILAVTMSSIDSILIGGSTIVFTESGLRPNVTIARIITAIFGIAGFMTAFLISDIVQLSLILGYMVLVTVPAAIAGLYTKISAGASFYSVLLGAMALVCAYPFLGKNVFLLSTGLSIVIVVLYDRVIAIIARATP